MTLQEFFTPSAIAGLAVFVVALVVGIIAIISKK